MTSSEKFSVNLILEVQLSGKFERFNIYIYIFIFAKNSYMFGRFRNKSAVITHYSPYLVETWKTKKKETYL